MPWKTAMSRGCMRSTRGCWAGGKRQLLPELLARVPVKFGAYYEPFLGGGAMFFALRDRDMLKDRVVLGDANRELVNCWWGIQFRVEDVVTTLTGMPHSKDFYLQLRKESPNYLDCADLAARFIYLNRTGYNGLYRVNKSGAFNVPFGDYKDPTICDAAGLRAAARALEKVTVTWNDFARAVEDAGEGDLVYLDSPYPPRDATAKFDAYTVERFGPEDHERLRDLAVELKFKRGSHVLLSNADVPPVWELYEGRGFTIKRVSARRNINCKGGGRGPVGEVIIT